MKFALSLLAVIGVAQADWQSGAVASKEKFTYGKFIARMQTPNKKGTVASFFTYWDGPNFYPGGWNEIDMNVVPSVQGNTISTNVIYGDGHTKTEDHQYVYDDLHVKTNGDREDKKYTYNHNPGNEWHTYEMQWTPDTISFFYDGEDVRHMNTRDHESISFMHKAQELRMNFWTPTFPAWGADLNASDMPWYLLFDYVEVYSYNQNSKQFDFEWRDDFNEFDQHRWHKQSGTFEGNSSFFSPANVFTKDGNLVLKMEPMEHHIHDHEDIHEHYYKGREQHGVIHGAPKDATMGAKPKASLGKLQPREDLKKGTTVGQQQAQPEAVLQAPEGHNLKAKAPVSKQMAEQPRQMVEHYMDHETHHELDHRFDHQHDIEPVHFHEHSILKAVQVVETDHDDDLIDLQQDQKVKATKKTVAHPQVHEEREHQHLHSATTKDSVVDVTPYEHKIGEIHGSEHFWDASHHDRDLEDRLREHYMPEEHEHISHDHHDLGFWKEPFHDQIHHDDHPVYHEQEHYQQPHHEAVYRTEHETHHELDHHFDHQHDIEPIHYHEHAVYRAVDHRASQPIKQEETLHEPVHQAPVQQKPVPQAPVQQKPVPQAAPVQQRPVPQAAPVYYAPVHQAPEYHEPIHQSAPYHEQQIAYHHEEVHHDVARHIDHDTHHELDHQFDHQHDVEPVHYHEHAVHQAFDHPQFHEYQHEEPHHEPVYHEQEHYQQPHHQAVFHAEHETHHELDHQFDHQHDVEPVQYHEQAIHTAFDQPQFHEYQHEEPHHEPVYAHEVDTTHYYSHPAPMADPRQGEQHGQVEDHVVHGSMIQFQRGVIIEPLFKDDYHEEAIHAMYEDHRPIAHHPIEDMQYEMDVYGHLHFVGEPSNFFLQ